jgi:TPR repeat protein
MRLPENPALGFSWLLQAAKQGDAEAQVAVGDSYLFGRGTERDKDAAARWFALADRSDAWWKLGQLVESHDPKAAAEFYRRAADHGFAPAMNSLANLHLAGRGVALDYSKALALYQQAASHHFAEAELNLSGMYFQGMGVERNLQTAYEWAQLASRHGARDANAFLQLIRDQRGREDSDR